MKDPADNITSYGYDAAGNRTSVTDPIGMVATYAYDALNRKIQSNTPGSQGLQATGSVDASGIATWTGGFSTSQSGMIGAAVSWTTSNAALKLELLNGAGSVIATATNVSGGPESLTYANAPPASYSLRVSATSGSSAFTLNYSVPVTEVRTIVYDIAGRQTSTTDALGTTQTTYDNADRRSTVTLQGGSTQTFTYWADGVPKTQVDATGVQSFGYDNARQLKTVTDQASVTTTYGYDNSGNQNAITRSSGPGSAVATWDKDNRLCAKAPSGAPLCSSPALGTTSFAYTDNVNRTVTTQASGEVDTRSHDQGGLVTEAKGQPSQAGAATSDQGYSYDAQNNLSSTQDLLAGTTPATYAYDTLDRLTSETLLIPGQSKAQTFSYSYDARGNRTQLISGSGPSGTTTFTYNPAGQLMRTIPGTGIPTSYVYDLGGNLIRGIGAGGSVTYVWNSQRQLSQVTLPSGVSVALGYDALGHRRTKSVSGNTTTYSYDEKRLISAATASGTVSFTYDDVGAPLTITLPSGATYTYHYDGGGSTLNLTNSNHQVAASYFYDAWGNVLAQSGDSALLDANRYTYRGQYRVQFDSETGLYLMGARYYDPVVGRFISRDPAESAIPTSTYVYADDNPSTKVDPNGFYPIVGQVTDRYHWKYDDYWTYYTCNGSSPYTCSSISYVGVAETQAGISLNGRQVRIAYRARAARGPAIRPEFMFVCMRSSFLGNYYCDEEYGQAFHYYEARGFSTWWGGAWFPSYLSPAPYLRREGAYWLNFKFGWEASGHPGVHWRTSSMRTATILCPENNPNDSLGSRCHF